MRAAIISAILSFTGVLAAPTRRDVANSIVDGPGLFVMNKSKEPRTFYFFDNKENGCGTASPNFNNPEKHIKLEAGELQFIPLDITWKGRVQAGPDEPPSADDWWNWYRRGTWAEAQLQANPACPNADGGAHGDISFQSGCDRGAIIHSTTDNGMSNGAESCPPFTGAGVITRPDGSQAIDDNTNPAAVSAMANVKGLAAKVYTGAATQGVADVASPNNRLAIDFY